MKKSLLLSLLLAPLAQRMADEAAAAGEAATPTPEEALAADQAALTAAQSKLAADQADHDAAQAKLDEATVAHDQAHVALAADQEALATATAKFESDKAAFEAAVAAHNETVAQTAQVGEDAAVVAVDEVHEHLDTMEDIAIKWGGDIGTDLRNIVGKLKALFNKSSNTVVTTDTTAVNTTAATEVQPVGATGGAAEPSSGAVAA